jgi:hypothetical protein
MTESRVHSQIIMAEPVDGPPFLLAVFVIDCPFCGQVLIEIAGHHMRVIRDQLIKAIDLYPGLTQVGGTVVLEQTIKGPGNDPSTS